jgi:hypothetical protein
MPEVFRVGSLVFFFYSAEGNEPPHVHVRIGTAKGNKDGPAGKWWLSPVRCAYADGFKPGERRKVERLIVERRSEILDAWKEHFDIERP